MKKAIREAPTYWPLKVVSEELLETRDENSQNPRCISPVAANNSNPNLFLPSKKSQKGKKKTHKLHHLLDCLQPTQPAHTPQPTPPSINLEQGLLEMENATNITEIKYTLAIENQQKFITALIAQTALPASKSPYTPSRKRKNTNDITTLDDDSDTC